VLGVSEHATPDELRTAFRRASRTTHPDLGGSDAAFDDTVAAYSRLSLDAEAAIRGTNVKEAATAPALVAARAGFDAYDSAHDSRRRARESAGTAAPDFADVLRVACARWSSGS